jgi:hypothetical protein
LTTCDDFEKLFFNIAQRDIDLVESCRLGVNKLGQETRRLHPIQRSGWRHRKLLAQHQSTAGALNRLRQNQAAAFLNSNAASESQHAD